MCKIWALWIYSVENNKQIVANFGVHYHKKNLYIIEYEFYLKYPYIIGLAAKFKTS